MKNTSSLRVVENLTCLLQAQPLFLKLLNPLKSLEKREGKVVSLELPFYSQKNDENGNCSGEGIEFPTTNLYELESRVLTDHWSIPYKREESLGKCLIASTYLARLGKFSFYTYKDYLFKGFHSSMAGSYVFRVNLAVVYLAPCRMITSLSKWLTVNYSTQCCKKNVGLFFFSKVICLLKLF